VVGGSALGLARAWCVREGETRERATYAPRKMWGVAAAGAAYVSSPDTAPLHSYLGFANSDSLFPEGFRSLDADALADRLAAADDRGVTQDLVIASSENFSFFFERSAIAALKGALQRHFDDIRIVSYLRRQDRHAVSHHQEGAKANRRAEGDLWGHALNALPTPSSRQALYLDYDRRLGLWADEFGDDRLTLRVYDRALMKDGDIVADFLALVGLNDVAARAGLPQTTLKATQPVGALSAAAAGEPGLTPSCLVAPGLIDAYAGTIALFSLPDVLSGDRLETHLALIAGTSSCVVQLTRQSVQAEGCWGAFRDVAIADLWLTEAGQSASGALLDHILQIHPAGGEPSRARHAAILNHVAERIEREAPGYGLPIHVLPDFHGTRSPTTDPDLTGTIAGMTLDRSFDGLCRLYWRTCVALACGIRHIIAHMPGEPGRVRSLAMAGGFSNHPLIPQLYADVLDCAVLTPVDQDAVLLGTAQHAAVSGGVFADMAKAGAAMAMRMQSVSPNPALRNC